MLVRTIEDALDVYYKSAGDNADIPAHVGSTEYDAELGGWLFENVNGPEGCANSVSCGEVVFVAEAAEPVAALDGGGRWG